MLPRLTATARMYIRYQMTEHGDSRSLPKTLTVRDLVLAQLTMVLGATWVGIAATLGTRSLLYWAFAAVAFFVPLTATVLHLNAWRALEGGIYQWAKFGFGERAGFCVAFFVWASAVVFLSSVGIQVVRFVWYAFDADVGWMASSPRGMAAISIGIVVAVAICGALGMRYTKWLHNAAGASRIFTFGALIVTAAVLWIAGRPLGVRANELAPHDTTYEVNVLANMGFGAFSGFEYIAIWSAEAHDARRSIARSVWITAPIAVAMFALGTISVLAFTAPSKSISSPRSRKRSGLQDTLARSSWCWDR
jgi:amino acid transporter